MEILPHQLMHYLSLGMEEKPLAANTIWMCAGCFTCAVRCPNDIDITSVMDALRQKSIRMGLPCPKPGVLTIGKITVDQTKGELSVGARMGHAMEMPLEYLAVAENGPTALEVSLTIQQMERMAGNSVR